MKFEAMEELLSCILRREDALLDPPTEKDWSLLCSKFGCEFDGSFRMFIEFMSKYRFPGEIYNVSTGVTNGNDPIGLVYDLELSMGKWDPRMIPFYGIGNGDYFCLNKDQCPASPVYYHYLDLDRYEKYSETFSEWLNQLPDFLSS